MGMRRVTTCSMKIMGESSITEYGGCCDSLQYNIASGGNLGSFRHPDKLFVNSTAITTLSIDL
jgi:hypothetical protein